MTYTLLRSGDAFWRESNQMRIANTDLAGQLGAEEVGARLWRLAPGQASTWHRHTSQEELYLLLEGEGRIRVGEPGTTGDTTTLGPLDSMRIAPGTMRQIFNDTAYEALWLVFGAPREAANTLELSEETLAFMYPDGPRVLPPELGGGQFAEPSSSGR